MWSKDVGGSLSRRLCASVAPHTAHPNPPRRHSCAIGHSLLASKVQVAACRIFGACSHLLHVSALGHNNTMLLHAWPWFGGSCCTLKSCATQGGQRRSLGHALQWARQTMEMNISPFQYFDPQRSLARTTAAGGEGNNLSHRAGELFCRTTAARARPRQNLCRAVARGFPGLSCYWPRATNTTSTVQSCPKTLACTRNCNVSSC
jgi:hypothetical protein